MLKKPYELIEKRGINRYYMLTVNDTPYIGIETVVQTKYSEFTQSLRLVRVNAPVLATLLHASQTEELGLKKNSLGEDEPRYAKVDVVRIREELQTLILADPDIKDSHFLSISFPDTVRNATVEALLKEGNTLLTVEKEGSFMNTVWLVRSDELGNLRLFEIITAGSSGFDIVVGCNVYSLDRALIKKILEKLPKEKEKTVA